MKTPPFFLFIIIVWMVVSCSRSEVPCAPIQPTWNGKRPVDSYNYPVRPGMPEWANLKTGAEQEAACQVPKNILENMTTQAIVQSILEHPLFTFFLFTTEYYKAVFDDQLYRNNACMELLLRKDGGKSLLERYILSDPLSELTSVLKFESQMLELFLTQTVFLSQLNDCEKKEIVKTAFNKYDVRHKEWYDPNQSDLYLDKSNFTVTLLIGNVIHAANYTRFCNEVEKNDELRAFLVGKYSTNLGYFYSSKAKTLIPMILDFGKSYLKK